MPVEYVKTDKTQGNQAPKGTFDLRPSPLALWFAALLILTVAVRFADPTGWLGSDDASYYRAAEHLRTGQTIERLHHQYARAAVIIPVALSTSLFGDHPAAVALPSFAASLMCVVLVVVLGRMAWGWWEGLFAGTVLTVLPYFRVLSTTGFPDVHACLWTTVALVLAIQAARQPKLSRALAYGVACGFASGLMASAKILAAAGIVGVIATVWTQDRANGNPRAEALLGSRGTSGSRRAWILAAVLCGGMLFGVMEGGLFLWLANDFWFHVHALHRSHALSWVFPENRFLEANSFAELAWKRLLLPFDPASSGWGYIAVAFWPASIALLLWGHRGRAMAIWAIATYLVVALVPISFRNGPQPFPIFDGRNVLFACVPFTLCLAWATHRIATWFLPLCHMKRAWAVALPGVALLAYGTAGGIAGFRDRPTARVGRAIERIIHYTAWDHTREIFMPAPLYIRHGILFPPELRGQLRVAVDDNAPDWWRRASVDIVSRVRPLPDPGSAYLIATPQQLEGRPEPWDYGVTLPRQSLPAWRTTPPRLITCRFRDKTIGPWEDSIPGEPLLVLFGPSTFSHADARSCQLESVTQLAGGGGVYRPAPPR